MRQPVWIVLIVVALAAGFFGGWLSKGSAAPDAKLVDQVNQLQQAVEDLQAQVGTLAKAAEVSSLQQQVDALAQEVQRLRTTGAGGARLRIAYVNAEEVFLKYKGTAAAVQQFKEEKDKKEQELQRLQADFQAGKISAEEYQARVIEIQQELQKLDLELTAKVQQEMLEVISAVAKEKGYDWVTRKKDVVLYVGEGVMDDITSLVIQRLNARLEAETPASPGG